MGAATAVPDYDTVTRTTTAHKNNIIFNFLGPVRQAELKIAVKCENGIYCEKRKEYFSESYLIRYNPQTSIYA